MDRLLFPGDMDINGCPPRFLFRFTKQKLSEYPTQTLSFAALPLLLKQNLWWEANDLRENVGQHWKRTHASSRLKDLTCWQLNCSDLYFLPPFVHIKGAACALMKVKNIYPPPIITYHEWEETVKKMLTDRRYKIYIYNIFLKLFHSPLIFFFYYEIRTCFVLN